jgi:uncharacterized protein
MTDQQRWRLRWDLLSELVSLAPNKLGRTAVMKLAYVLQTIKDVPLGYDFRLYTYGPFDSDVLNDLAQVEALGAVKSQMVAYPSGYGYVFSKGPKQAELRKLAKSEAATYRDAIAWALEEFGDKTAADQELLSTIIYADRDAAQKGSPLSSDELARKVKDVKPKFGESYILQNVRELVGKGLLSATC